ncbi:MAG: stress response translation initiation inhibitor YciH [Nanoarchaeota archaeon]
MTDDTCNVCGLPNELCVCQDVEKESALINVKVEKRKYGKLWAVVSGIEADSGELKNIVKQIKNRLACGGTVKGKSIEILYGRNERNKELVEVLTSLGFNKDSINFS